MTEIGYVGSFGTTTKGMVGGVIRATVCVYKLTADPNIVVVVNSGKVHGSEPSRPPPWSVGPSR